MSAALAVGEEGPLAMLCGGGSLPLAVAEKVVAGGRSVVLFPLRGAAEGTAVERFPHHWVHIGQIGKFLRLARAAGCHEVVFIGSLVRPSLWQVHPDLKGLRVLPRVLAAYRGGDDHLLSSMGKVLEDEGFRLLGAHEVAPDILMPEGALGRARASERDHADIALGLDYLRTAGKFDIGQAVVVAGRHVLGGRGGRRNRCHARACGRDARERPRSGSARHWHIGKGAEAGARSPLRSAVDRAENGRGCRACGACGYRGRRRENHHCRDGAAGAGGRPCRDFRSRRFVRNRTMSPHIFLVAGEESGDRLGAALIAAIRQRTQGRAQFSCVGGAHMTAEGVPSLFPLGDLAIIGFAAIPAQPAKDFPPYSRNCGCDCICETRCVGYYR